MTVADSPGLRLSDDVLASGTGGAGEQGSAVAGDTGGSGKPPVANAGGAGGAACPANPPPGPIGKGGYGADFQQLYSSGCFIRCKCDNNNYPASVGKNGENSGNVLGGTGGPRAGPGCFCDGGRTAGNGPAGQDGRSGACSEQGGLANPDRKGSFAGTVWHPNRAGNGAAGELEVVLAVADLAVLESIFRRLRTITDIRAVEEVAAVAGVGAVREVSRAAPPYLWSLSTLPLMDSLIRP